MAALACILGCSGAQATGAEHAVSYAIANGSWGCYWSDRPGCVPEAVKIAFSYDTTPTEENQLRILSYSMQLDLPTAPDLSFYGWEGDITFEPDSTILIATTPLFTVVVDAHEDLSGKYIGSESWLNFTILGAFDTPYNQDGWVAGAGWDFFKVPVPGTAWLAGLGLIGLASVNGRRARAKTGQG